MTSESETEKAIRQADLYCPESMLRLYNIAAYEFYMLHSPKRYNNLKRKKFLRCSWSEGLRGDEWSSIDDCVYSAQEAAMLILEDELNNSNLLTNN